tara:strand:+ start:533 stop:1498 length:966 start_codon:yes stop_codon:yes gene_type:complete
LKKLSELHEIEQLTQFKDSLFQCNKLIHVSDHKNNYPLWGFRIGTEDPYAPCLGLFGGVHGLERVGTQVVTHYLDTLLKQLKWDHQLRDMFKHCRIISIPLINPIGMAHHTRSNYNGVDLMRNSPAQGKPGLGLPLLSGQRYSNKIPWYRGQQGAPLEPEAQAVVDFVKKYMFESKSSISIDFHSGFGLKDRLWYPWAKSKEDFPHFNQVQNLIHLLDETLPFHIYKTETQSASYIINGDLWDHIYMEKEKNQNFSKNTYIPWTLEMGSWMWVKKNPLQLFSKGGLFNPVKSHRFERTMRRHILMINFFLKAVQNPHAWTS